MGLKESKISFFPQEEVQRRGKLIKHNVVYELKRAYLVFSVCFESVILVFILVTEDELKRLRLAFKKLAGASGVMNKMSFFREVLGESVPPKLAEVTSFKAHILFIFINSIANV